MSLPGIGAPVSVEEADEPFLLNFLDAPKITSNGSTFTYTSQPLGSATDRWIVVVVHINDTTNINSVTIGGTAATQIYSANVSQTTPKWYARKLTAAEATTGTIVVSFSGSNARNSIGIWEVDGRWSGTLTDSDQTSGAVTNPSLTLDVPAGGAILASQRNIGGQTTTWINATSLWEFDVEGGGLQVSGGQYLNAGGATSVTVTASGVTSARMSAISLGL